MEGNALAVADRAGNPRKKVSPPGPNGHRRADVPPRTICNTEMMPYFRMGGNQNFLIYEKNFVFREKRGLSSKISVKLLRKMALIPSRQCAQSTV
jgi:hypothetical protein